MRAIHPLICLWLVLASAGCVSKASYKHKVDEAAMLLETVQGLEAKLQQLSSERTSLNEKLAESLQQNSALNQDLLRARADLARVEKLLAARHEEAGRAMGEMRQTIDRLTEESRELGDQLEKERVVRQAQVAQMKSTYDGLVGMLESEIKRGEVTISELEGKLTLNLVERILFDSGKAEIKPEGLKVLRRVGKVLKEARDKEIRVEGHTDNIPISPRLRELFPSNWELSTTRAANVVHFLQDEAGIPGERLSVAGYGEFRPVAGNDIPEGRAQNRRIQIILVPLEGVVVKPAR